MKKILYFTLIVSLFACDWSQNAKKESRFKNFLSKFKEKSFDTLKVYSPQDLTGEYKGVELDSADAVLFPEYIAQQYFGDPPGLFAIYKFAIDSNRIGLIARTPSEYAPTSIKLFLYDKRHDSIASYIELAENWGDAGDYMTKDAWIYKDKGMKSFIWVMEGHDNSVDNEKDTTVQEQNYYYLLDLSKDPIDTLSKDKKELEKIFSNLIEPHAHIIATSTNYIQLEETPQADTLIRSINYDNWEKFWKAFTNATAKKDTATIVQLTHFPFLQNASPVDKKEFVKSWISQTYDLNRKDTPILSSDLLIHGREINLGNVDTVYYGYKRGKDYYFGKIKGYYRLIEIITPG